MELLVAVAIGLMLTVAVLTVQLRLSTQNVRTTDVGMRDNEARASMDAISRDVGNAGFLFGGTHLQCFATLNFNAAAPAPSYFTSYSVSSMVAANGTALPFVAAPGLSLNYPAAGSANRSDVLVISATLDGSRLPPNVTPNTSVVVNNSYTPMSNGTLPVASNLNFGVNQIGLLQIPMGQFNNAAQPQQRVCLRIPISAVSVLPVNNNDSVSSAGGQMPVNFYTGFSGQISSLGLTGATGLTDALLKQSKLTNLGGTAVASNQRTYSYFIDANPARYLAPTLVRASIDALTDLEIATERQEIGVGVVSLQILFGVDPVNTGGVTAYQTGAQVIAAGNSSKVRSAKILVLTRSIYPDKDFTNPQAVLPFTTWFNEPGFTNYTIGSGELSNRFVVQQTEVAVRNELW